MKTITEKILDGVKHTLETGDKVTIDLREAASLTGSGDGQGGRTYFDDAFAALRYANPFRQGSRQIKVAGSSAQFVAKTGNAANQTNPWGYTFTPDSGTPGTNTSIWQIPTRVITAQLPIRTAAMSDINYLNETIVEDLMLEFSAIEAASMAVNNDQTGTTTTTTGGTDGLRGISSYPTSSVAAYGSSGVAITNGLHTLAAISASSTVPTFNLVVNMANALPSQYWCLPGTAWHIHPSLILSIRQLKNTAGLPLFQETGGTEGGQLVSMLGFPVIPNPYLDTPGIGSRSMVLANWPQFLTIADVEEMSIQAMEETTPGFITLFAEKRMVSTVRNPFAGVVLVGT
jgi:HK97 family phage major capsid protein